MKTNTIIKWLLATAMSFSMAACSKTEESTQTTSKSFGTLSDGTEASLYTLENKNGMSIALSDYGATLVQVNVLNKDGDTTDVILGYDDVSGYESGKAYIGGIVGRVANRIADASFELNGKTYTLTANDGDNTNHSGVECYNYRMWDVKEQSDDSITFEIESSDGDQGFPGNVTLDVTYTLTDDNEIQIDYEGTSDADTLLAPTSHGYFNLNGAGNGDVLDQLVTINADSYTELDDENIPTGNIVDVTDTDFDFREERTIGQARDGNYDQNFAINGDGFREAATMYSTETGIKMTVSTDFPGVQFYTACSTDETGKNGDHYGSNSAACFEGQYFPDAIHHDNFTQPILKANETFTAKTVYAFTVE